MRLKDTENLPAVIHLPHSLQTGLYLGRMMSIIIVNSNAVNLGLFHYTPVHTLKATQNLQHLSTINAHRFGSGQNRKSIFDIVFAEQFYGS